MKPPLLLLSHRIPYPPDKGDKIRSYHLLRYLSEHYSVHLGTFIDDVNDLQYRSQVESFCVSTKFVQINPRWRRLFSLTAIFGNEPLSNRFYSSKCLQKWVNSCVRENRNIPVVLFSSTVAQFILNSEERSIGARIVDFVDIDSDKWKQFAERTRWPMSWIYDREYRYLRALELKIHDWADITYFVSNIEAKDFASLISTENASKVDFYCNGVDCEYFQESEQNENPFLDLDCKPIVFTGAMDYWPNVDAVVWFANKVLPQLRTLDPAFNLYIVGSSPSNAVLSLSSLQGVKVTGRVDDIRPYMQYSYVIVAPMRIARGVQNKVLEAMAMQKPIVLTEMALVGIDAHDREHVLVANSAEETIDSILWLNADRARSLGQNSLSVIENDFDWNINLKKLHERLIQEQSRFSKESLCSGLVEQ